MLQKEACNYVDDIKLHVHEMAHLPKEVRERFKSDMRIIVDYLAEGENYIVTGQKIQHLEALLLMLEALSGDSRYGEMIAEALEQERKGGAVTMCELIDKYINKGIERGMERGIERGIEQGRLMSVKNLMKNLKLTATQAMEALGFSEEEQGKYLQLL